jgi:hypothetical protein
MHTVFLLEDLKVRDLSEDLDVYGKIIIKWISGKQGGEIVDWIHLAQDKDQWGPL